MVADILLRLPGRIALSSTVGYGRAVELGSGNSKWALEVYYDCFHLLCAMGLGAQLASGLVYSTFVETEE